MATAVQWLLPPTRSAHNLHAKGAGTRRAVGATLRLDRDFRLLRGKRVLVRHGRHRLAKDPPLASGALTSRTGENDIDGLKHAIAVAARTDWPAERSCCPLPRRTCTNPVVPPAHPCSFSDPSTRRIRPHPPNPPTQPSYRTSQRLRGDFVSAICHY